MIEDLHQRPYARALARHEAEEGPRTFEQDLVAHFATGYVISTPEVFMLLRTVHLSAPDQMLVNPWCVFHRDESNAWFVYLLAGKLGAAARYMPFWLPYLAYERRGVVRRYPTAKLLPRL